jgi:hypothetical protein
MGGRGFGRAHRTLRRAPSGVSAQAQRADAAGRACASQGGGQGRFGESGGGCGTERRGARAGLHSSVASVGGIEALIPSGKSVGSYARRSSIRRRPLYKQESGFAAAFEDGRFTNKKAVLQQHWKTATLQTRKRFCGCRTAALRSARAAAHLLGVHPARRAARVVRVVERHVVDPPRAVTPARVVRPAVAEVGRHLLGASKGGARQCGLRGGREWRALEPTGCGKSRIGCKTPRFLITP